MEKRTLREYLIEEYGVEDDILEVLDKIDNVLELKVEGNEEMATEVKEKQGIGKRALNWIKGHKLQAAGIGVTAVAVPTVVILILTGKFEDKSVKIVEEAGKVVIEEVTA